MPNAVQPFLIYIYFRKNPIELKEDKNHFWSVLDSATSSLIFLSYLHRIPLIFSPLNFRKRQMVDRVERSGCLLPTFHISELWIAGLCPKLQIWALCPGGKITNLFCWGVINHGAFSYLKERWVWIRVSSIISKANGAQIIGPPLHHESGANNLNPHLNVQTSGGVSTNLYSSGLQFCTGTLLTFTMHSDACPDFKIGLVN